MFSFLCIFLIVRDTLVKIRVKQSNEIYEVLKILKEDFIRTIMLYIWIKRNEKESFMEFHGFAFFI